MQTESAAEIPPPRSPALSATQPLRRALWPQSLPYYSPLRAEYIVHLDESDDGEDPILARDGLTPLLWFFRRRPDSVRRRFYVHVDAAPFVPPSWRSRVGMYRPRVLKPAPSPPDEVIFFALVSELNDGCLNLEPFLANLRRHLGRRRWSNIKKSVYLPQGPERRGFEAFRSAFVLELGRLLGSGARALDWGEVKTRESFDSALIVDLNGGLLSLDGFLSHHALSRGGRLFAPAQGAAAAAMEAAATRTVALSPLHGFDLCERLEGPVLPESLWREMREVELFYSGVEAIAESDIKDPDSGVRGLPWPSWFDGWVKEFHRRAGSAYV